jgi:hypothetical protein
MAYNESVIAQQLRQGPPVEKPDVMDCILILHRGRINSKGNEYAVTQRIDVGSTDY